jgi:tRNA pseudouridine55 synthase
VNALLIVDKPPGPTSHDVVQAVRKVLGEARVGHAGTLDPAATGVLVLLIGSTTRLCRYLRSDKEYLATVVFGASTDTYDATGEIVGSSSEIPANAGVIQEVCRGFEGEIEQVPPMFSAVHHEGKRLYELAREGVTVRRRARTVLVSSIDVLSYEPPRASLRVSCDGGTYIRSLAHDIGARLGCGAHLERLRRTRVGPFCIDQAVTLAEVRRLASSGRLEDHVVTPSEGLAHLPKLVLGTEQCRALSNGQSLARGGRVRVRLHTEDDVLLGVGETADVRPLTITARRQQAGE